MAATKRGLARDRTPLEIVLGQNNSANSELQTHRQEPSTLPDLWTYQGTACIGRYYVGPDGFGAFSNDGDYLGTFTTIGVARAAVWDAHCAAPAPARIAA